MQQKEEGEAAVAAAAAKQAEAAAEVAAEDAAEAEATAASAAAISADAAATVAASGDTTDLDLTSPQKEKLQKYVNLLFGDSLKKHEEGRKLAEKQARCTPPTVRCSPGTFLARWLTRRQLAHFVSPGERGLAIGQENV